MRILRRSAQVVGVPCSSRKMNDNMQKVFCACGSRIAARSGRIVLFLEHDPEEPDLVRVLAMPTAREWMLRVWSDCGMDLFDELPQFNDYLKIGGRLIDQTLETIDGTDYDTHFDIDNIEILDELPPAKLVWVCPDCGSQDVQQMMWVALNTDEIDDDGSSSDYWCPACEGHPTRVCQIDQDDPRRMCTICAEPHMVPLKAADHDE